MRKNNGFTLIEMLIVVIVLGVILAIAIPSVTNLMNNQGKKTYDTQMDLIEGALDLYVLQNKGVFNSHPSGTCFIIDYDIFLEKQDFKKADITCDEDEKGTDEEGTIIITKNDKDYTYQYNFTCKDKNGTKYGEQVNITKTCVELN